MEENKVETIETKVEVKESWYIGEQKDCPEFMKDNEYILGGYRIGFNSKRRILRSLFMVHNESVNVWSHLIGATLFVLLIVYTSIYVAPPSIYTTDASDLRMKWMNDMTTSNP
jgi:adiponectin receptor